MEFSTIFGRDCVVLSIESYEPIFCLADFALSNASEYSLLRCICIREGTAQSKILVHYKKLYADDAIIENITAIAFPSSTTANKKEYSSRVAISKFKEVFQKKERIEMSDSLVTLQKEMPNILRRKEIDKDNAEVKEEEEKEIWVVEGVGINLEVLNKLFY
ncbi:hypothetical protein C1646_755931 [Rhizophagus diaphanus]|nr:hypothetical protein C1646_755931 [Rhizophagus diaphanus] [Rhizophagus sp. MUCL 43196]